MPSRVRWGLALFILFALIVAGALFYELTQADRVSPPQRSVGTGRPEAPPGSPGNVLADPAGMTPSAQSELNCVDRLLRREPAEGLDLKAEWDRCAALGEAGQNQMMRDDPRLELDSLPAIGGGGNAAGRPR